MEGRSGDRSTERSTDRSVGLMVSMRQLSILGALAGVAAVAFDYEHGMPGFLWIQDWVSVRDVHAKPPMCRAHEIPWLSS